MCGQTESNDHLFFLECLYYNTIRKDIPLMNLLGSKRKPNFAQCETDNTNVFPRWRTTKTVSIDGKGTERFVRRHIRIDATEHLDIVWKITTDVKDYCMITKNTY